MANFAKDTSGTVVEAYEDSTYATHTEFNKRIQSLVNKIAAATPATTTTTSTTKSFVTKEYDSGAFTPTWSVLKPSRERTSSNHYDFKLTHGLGGTPKVIQAYFVVPTGNTTWSAGTHIQMKESNQFMIAATDTQLQIIRTSQFAPVIFSPAIDNFESRLQTNYQMRVFAWR